MVCLLLKVLSCIDCGKDFYGDEYKAHDSCISEAEKYQGGQHHSRTPLSVDAI
jgi:cell growth-regulating nucleolar protein